MNLLEMVVHQEVCSTYVCGVKETLAALGYKLDFTAI